MNSFLFKALINKFSALVCNAGDKATEMENE